MEIIKEKFTDKSKYIELLEGELNLLKQDENN